MSIDGLVCCFESAVGTHCFGLSDMSLPGVVVVLYCFKDEMSIDGLVCCFESPFSVVGNPCHFGSPRSVMSTCGDFSAAAPFLLRSCLSGMIGLH